MNLFDIPESKSPRLQWLDKHGIWTKRIALGDDDEEYVATAAGFDGRGDTEDEAVVNLAKKMGIKLWMEP